MSISKKIKNISKRIKKTIRTQEMKQKFNTREKQVRKYKAENTTIYIYYKFSYKFTVILYFC